MTARGDQGAVLGKLATAVSVLLALVLAIVVAWMNW